MGKMYGSSPTPPKGPKGGKARKAKAQDMRRFDKGPKHLAEEAEERYARERGALEWETAAPSLTTADPEYDERVAGVLAAPEEVSATCEADIEATSVASLMRACFNKPCPQPVPAPSPAPRPPSRARPSTAAKSRTPDTLRSRTPVRAQTDTPAPTQRDSPLYTMMTLD